MERKAREFPAMTDHELLLLIAADVADLKKAIEGNGQPGIHTRLAQVEAISGERKKAAAGGGVVGAVIALIVAYISRELGL